MRPLRHAAASLVAGAATFTVSGSPALGATTALSAFFIDLDHVPEYVLKAGLRRALRERFSTPMHLTDQRTYLLLHGYDAVALIFAGLWWRIYRG